MDRTWNEVTLIKLGSTIYLNFPLQHNDGYVVVGWVEGEKARERFVRVLFLKSMHTSARHSGTRAASWVVVFFFLVKWLASFADIFTFSCICVTPGYEGGLKVRMDNTAHPITYPVTLKAALTVFLNTGFASMMFAWRKWTKGVYYISLFEADSSPHSFKLYCVGWRKHPPLTDLSPSW